MQNHEEKPMERAKALKSALLVGMRWFFFLWHFSTDFSALYRYYAIFMRISCDFYANFMRISGFYANLRGFMRIA